MRKNKLIALIGTLTMAVTGLAAVGAGVSSKKAEGVSADTANFSRLELYFEDQNGWTTGNDPYISCWSLSYASNSGYSSLNDLTNNGDSGFSDNSTYANGITVNGNNVYFRMIFNGWNGSNKKWKVLFPWYITGFSYKYCFGGPSGEQGPQLSMSTSEGRWYNDYLYADGPAISHEHSGSSSDTVPFTTYSITYSAETGGTVSASHGSVSGNSYGEYKKETLTASPNTGYSFSKWTDNAGTQLSTSNPYTFYLNENKNIKAVFTAKTYTVTLNKNGGSGGDSSVTATYDSAMPAIASSNLPTRTGYRFAGYYDATTDGTKYYNADGTSAHVWDKTSASPTLYARWEKETYTISYENLKGASHSNPASYDVETNTITLTNPSNVSGFRFDGWFDNAIGGNQVTTIAKGSTGNKTIYAHWTEVAEYQITFYNEGGTQILQQSNVAEGTVPIYSGTSPTKESTVQYSYTYDGWSSSIGGAKLASLPVAAGAASYYAHFSQSYREYNIYFKSEDGTSTLETLNVAYSSVPEPTVSPTKTATDTTTYTFDGWSATVGGEKLDSLPAVTGETTYYAHFISAVRKYTITFSKGSGTGGDSSISVEFSESLPDITIPTAPSGKKFDGYYTAADGTGTKVYDLNGKSNKTYSDIKTTTLYAYYRDATSATIGIKSGSTFYIILQDAAAFWNTDGAKISVNFKNPVGGFLHDNVFSAQFAQVGDNTKLLSVIVPQLNGEDVYWTYAEAVRFKNSATEFKFDDDSIWNQCQPTGDDPATYINAIRINYNSQETKFSNGEWAMYTDAGIGSRKGFYIKPTADWLTNNAVFKVEFANPVGQAGTKNMVGNAVLIENSDGIYEVKVPQLDSTDVEWGTVQVFRYSSGGEFWNKTQEFTYNETNKNRQYVEITGWNEGSLKADFTDVNRSDLYGLYFLEQCAVCDADGKELKITSTIWGNCSSEYSVMSDFAQREFSEAKADPESEAGRERAASSYDYIVSKYSSTIDYITDFAGRKPTNISGSNRLFSINDVSTTTWIIAATAFIGIAAAGAFFIYKKRKEN